MKFSAPLKKAKILKRYKRFLSDLVFEGEEICAHVPNTGSMTTCWAENWDVYISKSDNPKRKLKYTLELTDNGESLICVNTSLTNKIVAEALEERTIKELPAYEEVKSEVKVHDSRLDFMLTTTEDKKIYIEVKNVTLKGHDGYALFPDAVSTRGQKHLKDLIKLKQEGHNAVMLYVINREDVERFAPAEDIDSEYSQLLKEASKQGVQVLAYQCKLSPEEIVLHRPLPIEL
ncbi:MAG: DNA/RNA nuclease SfsA [Halobacteriovoraceae bacterium]|nr:DNA/RNA nuclease SfsA [Halobacteriovoraceae bacterium]|tara:strand:- start:22353 stop:23048 length:696 start_codon:yes stop_codon:yes gene_type:complete